MAIETPSYFQAPQLDTPEGTLLNFSRSMNQGYDAPPGDAWTRRWITGPCRSRQDAGKPFPDGRAFVLPKFADRGDGSPKGSRTLIAFTGRGDL